MSKERSSNFEILRIISMILIILMHCTLFGFSIYNQHFSLNKVALDVLFAGGKIVVNCFILITGYFMIKSRVTLKKFLKIVFQVLFYSILIMLIGIIFMNQQLNFNSLLNFLFPIIHGNYWFITCYIVLFLLIPVINKTILEFGRNFHKRLTIGLLILWCLIPTIFFNSYVAYSDLGWFIVLYLVGSYIRLYLKDNGTFQKWLFKAAVCFIICIALTIGIDFLATKINYFKSSSPYLTTSTLTPYFVHFLNMNSLPLFLASVCLFLAFKNLKIKSSKIINTIAGTVFGIYIIHEHPYLKNYIWDSVFHNKLYYFDLFHIIGSAFITVFIIFVCGCIIDLLRKFLIEKPVFNFFDKYSNKWIEKIKNNKLLLKGKRLYEK